MFNFLDKYRSEIRTQPKNNNLDYLIDPVFRTINRLFVLFVCKFFWWILQVLVEIKNVNTLINNRPLFSEPVKNKQEAYEKLAKMSKNYLHATEKLFD